MWFPHLRGLLVALHLLAVTLLALPAPEGGMDRATWKDPTVQDELAAWAGRLDGWGVHVTPPELEDRLWQFSADYMHARETVLRPFGPYYEYCGTYQSWRMFVAPHRYPTRLHIDVHEHGEWRPAYVERDAQHDWLGRQLDSYRFRSAIFRFGWHGYERDYGRFADWVAGHAARDFPDADRVRVRLAKYRTLSPEEVREGREPEVEFVQPVERRLEGRR
ncbi:MAG TPA: hypothetical protein VFA26_06235 [Gemmataceae bacterium]|nr:hypothetical protein [Gemmataceae bacterium]